jgi:hypothetical protein
VASIAALHKTSEHAAWSSMIQRCCNPNNKYYPAYGGRGIDVCKRWRGLDGFQNFILDMDWKPAPEFTLDRKDNALGYSPKNCRWATHSQQQQNRRKLRTNTSGYIGVFWYNNPSNCKKPWAARIEQGYKTHFLGMYAVPEEAALQYDRAVIFFRGDDGITNLL